MLTLALAVALATAAPVIRDGAPDPRAFAEALYVPADIAAWSGDGLSGARVVDLVQRGDRLWAATLDGGLGLWDGASWTRLTTRDGLPSDRVIDLDAAGDVVWAATAGGLARVEDERVAQVWTRATGLPDDYTQAVFVAAETVWAGTYRGLARVRDVEVRTVLSPGSCFSLLRGPDRRVWVGYRGLRGLPDGEPIEGVDPAWRVYDALPESRGVWLATDTHGLIWLEDGEATPFWTPPNRGVFALARAGDRLFAATARDGLWHHDAAGWRHHGQETGLPSPVVNTVAAGPRDKVWAGTDRGVALVSPSGVATALPVAPLAAGIPVHDVGADRRGLAVASADGLSWLGARPPRGWEALEAAVARPPRAVRHTTTGWWVLDGDSALRLDKRGRLERIRLPDEAVAIAPTRSGALLFTHAHAYLWTPGATQLGVVGPRAEVRDAHTGWDGGTWIADADGLTRLGTPSRSWDTIVGARAVTTTPRAAWVASDGGLYRVDGSGSARSVSSSWGAGPLVAVAAFDHAVWAAGADGRVWGPDPSAPDVVDLTETLEGVTIHRLIAVRGGVWAATDRGLFFVRSPS